MADTDALLGTLTLDEKAALTAGGGIMSTVSVERVGIPTVNVTDGPDGARGPSFPGLGGPSSTCVPCGSAIGATWDPALAQRARGAARPRGARTAAAAVCWRRPSTSTARRSPAATSSATRRTRCCPDAWPRRTSAASSRSGVFATVKHFVGNDAEFERMTINSVIDERALRELYLLPFELAVREGGALGDHDVVQPAQRPVAAPSSASC